jgi:ribosome-associated heat shock protein Hsp15
MRLDKFLFFVRLTKTRGLAQAIVEQGHVRIDGAPVARSHQEIAPGQVVTLPLHGQVRVVRIDALPARRGPATEAQACYSDLTTQ